MLDLYVQKKMSAKTHKPYWALSADFGYRMTDIMFGLNDIAEFCDVSPASIGNLPLDKPVLVGSLNRKDNIVFPKEKEK